MYISLVIQRLFAILLDEERSLIRIDGFHADIAEVDIAGMVHPEAFGRQDAPHRGFGISLFFLILDGIVDGSKILNRHSTLVTERDIREPHILYRMPRQACDGTPH